MRIESFDNNSLQSICQLIADPKEGLTDIQIEEILSGGWRLPEPKPYVHYWDRLYAILEFNQNQNNNANIIVLFMKNALQYLRRLDKDKFQNQKDKLHLIISPLGLEIHDNGVISALPKVDTIKEQEYRTNKFRSTTVDRKMHPEIISICRQDIMLENYFPVISDATKSIADKIRDKTGLTEDGVSLVDLAFNLQNPLLAINSLKSESEILEQIGLINLIKAMFSMFRRTTANEPEVKWPIDEQDALDLLTSLSYIHRKLDKAVSNR